MIFSKTIVAWMRSPPGMPSPLEAVMVCRRQPLARSAARPQANDFAQQNPCSKKKDTLTGVFLFAKDG